MGKPDGVAFLERVLTGQRHDEHAAEYEGVRTPVLFDTLHRGQSTREGRSPHHRPQVVERAAEELV